LYFQGRTTPGKIVTNARPGESAHNFGIAVDWCRDGDVNRAGLQPKWALIDYKPLAEAAFELGLEAAYFWRTFKEGPHVQLDLKAKGITFKDLRLEHDLGGVPAVWAYLDLHGPWF